MAPEQMVQLLDDVHVVRQVLQYILVLLMVLCFAVGVLLRTSR